MRAADLLRTATDDPGIHDLANWLASGAPAADLADVLNATPSWRRGDTAARDLLIRSTAARLFPNLPTERIANALADGLAHYRDDTYPGIALETDNPYPPGSLEHLFFAILKHRDAPLSARQLRFILRPST